MTQRFRCELVTWAGVQRLSHKLALKIRNDGFHPDIVVAIARGGYVPARLVCDYLNLTDLRSIRIVHYTAGAEKQRTAELVEGLCRGLEGKNVLLVDDISDTGDTLELARDHLLDFGAGPIRIGVLHHKQTSTMVPDYYAQRIVKWRWITYPWAVVEDVTGFIERMPKRPADAAEAVRLLRAEYDLQVRESVVEEILKLQA
ncbi:MAG: phosphoribosyltransferase [Granulosicoccaceae bacterium]|jgi:hypoxanthine phosphoribosyltransferase